MNYLTTLWEHLRLFWRLRNGTKISDAKFVRCYPELFLGGGTKIPEKIKPVGFVSGALLYHEHKMSATTDNFFFAKKEWPKKARNVLFSRLIAIIWTRSEPEHYLCYQVRPRADLYCKHNMNTSVFFISGFFRIRFLQVQTIGSSISSLEFSLFKSSCKFWHVLHNLSMLKPVYCILLHEATCQRGSFEDVTLLRHLWLHLCPYKFCDTDSGTEEIAPPTACSCSVPVESDSKHLCCDLFILTSCSNSASSWGCMWNVCWLPMPFYRHSFNCAQSLIQQNLANTGAAHYSDRLEFPLKFPCCRTFSLSAHFL
jgi:hypothetical protein